MSDPVTSAASDLDVAILPTRRRTNLNALFLGSGPVMFFDSGEHAVIPVALPFPGPNGTTVTQNAALYQMSFNLPGQNGSVLSYGQILALAGDFYADPNNPISNQNGLAAQQQQVQANVNSLLVTPASRNEATNLIDIMQREFNAATPMAWRNLPPSNIYGTEYFDYQYNGITGGSYTSFTSSPRGRYLLIAATNWDHFGPDAVTCYKAAHSLALTMAHAATTPAALEQAYAVNAFADHYLTDLFSAGHIRTPRRQMYQRQFPNAVQNPQKSDYDGSTSGMSGSIAKAMHDEDSVNGLWVTNNAGDVWLCMGDGQYRSAANYANAALVQLAVNRSIQEIYAAYNGGPVPASSDAYEALRLVPSLLSGAPNYSPMLVPTGTDVWIRSDLDSLTCQQHEAFTLATTYGSLPSTPAKGPGLLGQQTTVIRSIPGGVIPAQLGAFGAPMLTQPPFSFGLSKGGAVHLVYLQGLNAVYATLNPGTETWRWVDTVGSGLASAPAVPPNPQGVEFFFITGNDLDHSGMMVAGSVTHAYLTSGLSTDYITTGDWGGACASAPVAATPTSSELSIFAFESDLKTLRIETRTKSSSGSASKTKGSIAAASNLVPAGQVTVVAMGAGDYRLFVPDKNGQVWYYEKKAGWQMLTLPSSMKAVSLIGATSWASSRLDWFARNTNGTLSHNWFNAPNWDPSGEVLSDISLISNPCAVSLGPYQLMVFYIAPDFSLRCHSFNGTTWSTYTFPSFKALSSPLAVAVPSFDRVDVIVMGQDNSFYHASQSGGGAWSTLTKIFVDTTLV